MTGIPASTIRRTFSTVWPAPSSFTDCAPPSCTSLPAFLTASSMLVWKLMKGISVTTSGRCAPLTTALVCRTMSSMVTGMVES